MDYKKFIEVGKTIKYKGKTLVCTECTGCTECYFNTLDIGCFHTCDYLCSGTVRIDNKSVIYKLKEEELSVCKQDIDRGTVITINNIKLEVIAQSGCIGCYFNGRFSCTDVPYKCSEYTRRDQTSIIFKKIDNISTKQKESRIEIPIGTVFNYKNNEVQCKEHNLTLKCTKCVFDHTDICETLECFKDKRKDHKDVFFEIKQSTCKINSLIDIDERTYKIVKYTSCQECAFIKDACDEKNYKCNAHERSDKTNIMYIELPKDNIEIGKEINYQGEILRIVDYIDCNVCFFSGKGICHNIKCNHDERDDGYAINFLKVYNESS